MSGTNDQIRIVQETVAGKEITFAHVIGGPAPIIYQKLGLNPAIDYGTSAIGIMNMTPPESAVIAADIAVKTVRDFKARTVSEMKVIFNVFKDKDYEIYADLLG